MEEIFFNNKNIPDYILYLENTFKKNDEEDFNTFIKKYIEIKNINLEKLLFLDSTFDNESENNILQKEMFKYMMIFKNEFNFEFLNITFLEILNSYKNIIEFICNNKINPNVVFLKKNKNNFDNIYKILNKKNTFNKNLIDLYLECFHNTPTSINKIYNFIYYLRKFPFFKYLIHRHFKEEDKEIYKLIVLYNLDHDLITLSKNFFCYNLTGYSLNNNSLVLENLYNLIENKNNIFEYNIFDKNYLKIEYSDLKKYYNTIELSEYGFYTNNNILKFDPEIFFQKSQNKVLYIIDLAIILFKIDKKTIDDLNLDYEILTTIIIKKLIYVYFLSEYYNIDIDKDIFIKNIKDVISDDNDIIVDVFIQKTNYINAFFLSLSFLLKNKEFKLLSSIKNIINKFKNFYNFFTILKKTNAKFYNICLFLVFTNKNNLIFTKFDSKENKILDFLIKLSEKFFKNQKRIIF